MEAGNEAGTTKLSLSVHFVEQKSGSAGFFFFFSLYSGGKRKVQSSASCKNWVSSFGMSLVQCPDNKISDYQDFKQL